MVATATSGIDNATARLEQAIRTTDTAVLAVGRSIEQIVPLATSSDEGAAGELAVARRLQEIADASSGFLTDTRGYLNRQAEVAREASAALRLSFSSAKVVSDLMAKSRMLALNLRIEATRTNTGNGGLQAIGQEMVQFAQQVKEANETILNALDGLSRTIPRLEQEASSMVNRANTFDDNLGRQLDAVREEVSDLQESVVHGRFQTDERNRRILVLANRALSELQFHDPLVQELRAVIAALTDNPSGLGGAAVARSVFGDTDRSRAAGVVDLF